MYIVLASSRLYSLWRQAITDDDEDNDDNDDDETNSHISINFSPCRLFFGTKYDRKVRIVE